MLALLSGATCILAQSDAQPVNPLPMPAVTVTATNDLSEETLIGPNQQPEWTTRRRFAITRIYVQPPWQAETEFGWDAVYPRGGSPQHVLQQEIELGLPYRFQVDYEIHGANFEEGTTGGGRWHYASSEFELRWALADWGKIPLNPTLKVEWKINGDGTDAAEANLLLGDELAPRWHWGSDLFYEQAVNGDRRTEKAVSLAVSYSVIDEKLGIGMETKLDSENDVDDRHAHLNLELGPSVQWRLTSRLHLDLESLFGVTGFAPHVETFVFMGYDFGPGSEPGEGVRPISLETK
ncbi:MAG TPA: hypothetical protein VNL17_03010 [Verrucomicrobiae bacterium]|nr:hypothetical protein [Verrucomicrobiae bacterium]